MKIDVLEKLATELSFATTAKQAARVRIQCTLLEWGVVQREAGRFYRLRSNNPSRKFLK